MYRILRRAYAQKPLDGEGSYRFGGRWSSPGTRLAYAAERLSLAMIEYFVHIDPDDPPRDLVLVTAEIPTGYLAYCTRERNCRRDGAGLLRRPSSRRLETHSHRIAELRFSFFHRLWRHPNQTG